MGNQQAERQYYYYKMIKIPKEDSDLARKQEAGGAHDDSSSNHQEKTKASASSSIMEQNWLSLQDPRIVRVARAYGGKDRHSKVCTVRGLRDRRVRLSVPTAIQLYGLQERLGFNQPSKVIDWLLNAAKNDIDELPPLPPLNLSLVHHHHHHAILTSNSSHQPNKEEEDGLEASNNNHTFWKLIEPKEASLSHDVKQGSRNNDNELSHLQHPHPHPHHHHPSFVGYHQSEGSVAGGASEGEHVSHQTDLQILNVVPFSSTLSLSTNPADSSSHHFPSSHFGANMDMDHNNIPRQVNYNYNYPMLMSSISNNLYPMSMPQSLKPFGLSMVTTPPNKNTADSHQSHNHLQNFPTK